MAVTRIDELDGCNALFLGLVGQHGTKGDITDAFDVLDGGVELVIDDDAAFAIQLDADRFKVQSLDVWSSSNGHEDNIRFQLLRMKIHN
jgi:hypothetical protein